MASPAYVGRCLCGGIRFTVASEPLAVIACYCEHCSKGAGGTSQVIAKVANRDIDVSAGQELVTQYVLQDTTSGAPKQKAFCSRCGATLWTIPNSARDKFYMVRTSLLSDWQRLKPATEIFVKNRPDWVPSIQGSSQWPEARH